MEQARYWSKEEQDRTQTSCVWDFVRLSPVFFLFFDPSLGFLSPCRPSPFYLVRVKRMLIIHRAEFEPGYYGVSTIFRPCFQVFSGRCGRRRYVLLVLSDLRKYRNYLLTDFGFPAAP